MRVVMLGPYPQDESTILGGVEAVVSCLLKHLAPLPDLELHLISCREGLASPGAREAGWTHHVLPRQRGGRLTFHRAERRSIVALLRQLQRPVFHAKKGERSAQIGAALLVVGKLVERLQIRHARDSGARSLHGLTRLEQVGAHYRLFDGHSPINEQTEALRDALAAALLAEGIKLPVVIGNRNWHPFTIDALRQIADSGGRRVLTLITAAYSSYSGCRQYRDDIAAQVHTLGVPLQVDYVRSYFNTAGFVAANVDAVVAAFRQLAAAGAPTTELVFVTHSIPTLMEAASGTARPATYSAQHMEVARLVSAGVSAVLGRELPWRLVYCSRSGPPHSPWLGPDVNEAIVELARAGRTAVLLAPIGFICDHMEVCLLYTSPSPRDRTRSRMPSSA